MSEATLSIQEKMDKASKTLAIMFDYLALDGSIRAEQKNEDIALIVGSEDAGRIIGRKGQTLESLQLLLNRMMQKADQEFPRVFIDIDGYSRKPRKEKRFEGRGRDKRRRNSASNMNSESNGASDADGDNEAEEFSEHDLILQQQALDAAKEVRRWGEPVVLPEMNAHDRRIIHISLQSESDLHTESEGEGNLKRVKITVKK